jgi:pentatricopeptide repeat protein
MRSMGLRINLITYNNALAALAKASKNHARRQDASRREDPENSGNGILFIPTTELLDQMKADGITLDGFSFSSAISCFGGQGRWEEALALLNLMTKGGPRTQPNKLVYTAAIGKQRDAFSSRVGSQYSHCRYLFG